jgi:GNAT superfamily N-acetyltransferase
LPDALENPTLVADRLGNLADRVLVALDGGRVAGYLGWWVVDNFRRSRRRGAYVPEWAHAALPGLKDELYRALYRAASIEWTAAGCGVHAITLLAGDAEAKEAWFWNGFGLAVVDAVRPAEPLDPAPQTTLTIRRASADDAGALAELDAEHVRHYAAAPVYMALPQAEEADAFREFIRLPKNSVWIARDGETPAGFMRFTGYDFDAVAALESDSAAFCNAAYLRPAYRGRRAGAALLHAALAHYADLGLTGVYPNFESFNPEAAGFWPRYFRPAFLSLMRVPEVLDGISATDAKYTLA